MRDRRKASGVPQTAKSHRIRLSLDNRNADDGQGGLKTPVRGASEGFYENRFMRAAVNFQKAPDSIFSNKHVLSKTIDGFKNKQMITQREDAIAKNSEYEAVPPSHIGQMFYRSANREGPPRVANVRRESSEVIADISTGQNVALNRIPSDLNVGPKVPHSIPAPEERESGPSGNDKGSMKNNSMA